MEPTGPVGTQSKTDAAAAGHEAVVGIDHELLTHVRRLSNLARNLSRH